MSQRKNNTEIMPYTMEHSLTLRDRVGEKRRVCQWVLIKKKKNTVEPRYSDTLRTRKKCHHKRSVAITGVGETYVYKKLYFL